MPPIGMAVIGAGYWGPNLVRTALATPALRLQWLCDLDVERAQAVLGPCSTVRATDRYDEVLADPGVSAVAIATPAASHFDLVRSALEAGKHVIVEKPLTPSVAEGAKLAALARQSGLVLMCDHTYCYTPAVRQIRELIRGGEIGEIQFVDSVRINLGLVQPDVDVLWDLAPHDLSCSTSFFLRTSSRLQSRLTPATRSVQGCHAWPTCRFGCRTTPLRTFT